MDTFADIQFRGVFRSYQQQVLDGLEGHLQDNRIHVVAAPGSGKTVLGLELMRRLGSPALVLSPTVTIQHQWGQRFEELFLPPGQDLASWMSFDLREPGAMTSMTYQGLHAAWNRLQLRDEEGLTDYAGLDLVQCVRRHGIKVLCLDEAHHLKAGWQSALEGLVAAVGRELTIIALTATPPYDSTPAEWSRYRTLCGEVDAEIAVPELVWQGDLCPHQDFVLLSHPTREERAPALQRYRQIKSCVAEIQKAPFFAEMIDRCGLLQPGEAQDAWRWSSPAGVSALLGLAYGAGMEIPREIRAEMFPKGRVPRQSLARTQEALQFVLDNPARMGEAAVGQLLQRLQAGGLLARRRVCLTLDARQEARLTASRGKLEQIRTIARAERENLGQALRLVVLTDRIDRELLPLVGTGSPVEDLGAVPVFEAVRQELGDHIPMAVLTGTLVLLPDALLGEARREAGAREIAFGERSLPGAGYTELTFGGRNRGKVALVTALFQRGLLQVVVGTKALLGEGWDAPCINALVLATFVGSFVQSNQMRGRAIRRDGENPGKVSNIWHLCTVLPPEDFGGDFDCGDYAHMVRRFACFIAPAYRRSAVESGIQRLDVLHGDFDTAGVGRINGEMLALAGDRAHTAAGWGGTVTPGEYAELLDVSDIPWAAVPPRFVFHNVLRLSALTTALCGAVGLLAQLLIFAPTPGSYLVAAALSLVAMGLLYGGYHAVLRLLSPTAFIRGMARALLEALQELGEIKSADADLAVEADPWGVGVQCALRGGTLREKKLFGQAVGELLSPFESPRYLLYRTRRRRPDYSRSFACPSVIAGHRKRVDVLTARLKAGGLPVAAVYTQGQPGKQMLLQAMRRSYINRNAVHVENRRVARRGSAAADEKRRAREQLRHSVKDVLWGALRRLTGRRR